MRMPSRERPQITGREYVELHAQATSASATTTRKVGARCVHAHAAMCVRVRLMVARMPVNSLKPAFSRAMPGTVLRVRPPLLHPEVHTDLSCAVYDAWVHVRALRLGVVASGSGL